MPTSAMKTTLARTGQVKQEWFLVDATDQVLGRLASRLATILMGKHKPEYTPHVDVGDFVVLTHVDKIKVSGKKREQKTYGRYSYYPGGYKEERLGVLMDRKPERVIQLAVRRMLPKNRLARQMLKKLKVYRGGEHPHQAQQPETLTW